MLKSEIKNIHLKINQLQKHQFLVMRNQINMSTFTFTGFLVQVQSFRDYLEIYRPIIQCSALSISTCHRLSRQTVKNQAYSVYICMGVYERYWFLLKGSKVDVVPIQIGRYDSFRCRTVYFGLVIQTVNFVDFRHPRIVSSAWQVHKMPVFVRTLFSIQSTRDLQQCLTNGSVIGWTIL